MTPQKTGAGASTPTPKIQTADTAPALYHVRTLVEAARALIEISQAGELADLRDALAAARREFNRDDGDRKWRRQSPLSEANRIGDWLADMTGFAIEECRDAARAAIDPQWHHVAVQEICRFAERLKLPQVATVREGDTPGIIQRARRRA
jgi:hypothetical protein